MFKTLNDRRSDCFFEKHIDVDCRPLLTPRPVSVLIATAYEHPIADLLLLKSHHLHKKGQENRMVG